MTAIEKSLLKTLLYSDIFDFPLTKEELWLYLMSKTKIDKTAFTAYFEKQSEFLTYKNNYFCLKGRESIITKRIQTIGEVHKKITIAKTAAYYLSFIPSIYFIGISGSVAVGNVNKDDDIDLFIITKKNTLFISRLCIIALLEAMNLRRKREEKESTNKICVNLIIEDTALRWPKNKHDLYTAHEIAHLYPLFERKNTYKRFLTSNEWVNSFLPNAITEKKTFPLIKWQRNYVSLNTLSTLATFYPFEFTAKLAQKYYMNRHRTNEIIKDNFLAFHPKDYRPIILKLLKKKTQQIGLLTS